MDIPCLRYRLNAFALPQDNSRNRITYLNSQYIERFGLMFVCRYSTVRVNNQMDDISTLSLIEVTSTSQEKGGEWTKVEVAKERINP